MGGWPFNFHQPDAALRVRLGTWAVWRIRLDDIEGVRLTSDPGLFFSRDFWVGNEHRCNLWPLRDVIMRRKSGRPSPLTMNPPDSGQFVGELKRRAPHIS